MSQPLELSVIVPLYNEEGNVENLHTKIVAACSKLHKSYEIIFINDGSTDTTLEKCTRLSPLTLIDQRKNFGQTAAFDAGFKNARGDIIITMDGDLQNDPEDIGKLLEKITEDYDVVSGWRWDRKDTLMKKFFSRGANILRKLFFKDTIHDSGCSLKAFRRECFDHLDLFGEMHRFIPALLEQQGFRIGEVKVSHHARIHGVTKYNWRRSVKSFADMISLWFWGRYSARPLHFFGTLSFLLSFIGIAILTWMFVEKIFFGESLSDKIWPLMGVLFVMLGVQFFIFGILADIMVKNYYKNQGHMNYAIRSITRQ